MYWWKSELEREWNSGKKINKTKYHKICNLYNQRREKAREILGTLNRYSGYVTCMPVHTPPPPPPPAQNKI